MENLDTLLSTALATVAENLDTNDFEAVTNSTDVFNNVDSFAIVDLMLETEMLLEDKLGRYVTLADESVFDAEKSPLLRWETWVKYVEQRCAE